MKNSANNSLDLKQFLPHLIKQTEAIKGGEDIVIEDSMEI